jgi:hypothetical protein
MDDESPWNGSFGGACLQGLSCANGSHKPTIVCSISSEEDWERAPGIVRLAPGALWSTGPVPRSPLDFARILHRMVVYCVVQATDWNYLLVLSKRPLERQFLVLWSANDRQGKANSWASHGPTSYLDWAVAMPRRYVARQAERRHFLDRVFSGACWWPLVGLRPVRLLTGSGLATLHPPKPAVCYPWQRLGSFENLRLRSWLSIHFFNPLEPSIQ